MLAVAVTLVALAGVAVALLAIPVVLAVDAEFAERLDARWEVHWLFGLVVAGSRDKATAKGPPRVRPERPATARPRAPKGSRRRQVVTAVLRTQGLLPRALRLVADLARQITIVRFQVRAAFGLDDPADTGRIYGTLSPVFVAASGRGLDLQCRPMFDRAGVTGALHATIRVRPLALGAQVVMFAVSPPVRRAAMRAWRARR